MQDNRTSYVRAKVRHEYDAHALEADPTKVTFLLRLAETQLDQVREQASHLAKVFSDPGVHAPTPTTLVTTACTPPAVARMPTCIAIRLVSKESFPVTS